MKNKVDYRGNTFPTSEKYQVFKVFSDTIWQIISPKAYYIDDNFKWDYFDLVFDDPITVKIICDVLNQEERNLNG